MLKIDFNNVDENITKSFLLSKHSQETYLEHYLGLPVRKGQFCSPLRVDKNPTCSFYVNKAGDVIFHDFTGHFSGDFVKVVEFLNNCSFYKALRIIASDFGLIDTPLVRTVQRKIIEAPKFKGSDFSEIRVQIKDFSRKELDWWLDRGVNSTLLKKFKIFSIKNVYLNGDFFTESKPDCPIYGYYGNKNSNGKELWRLYFPMKDKFRFLSNWKANKLQGAHTLPKEGSEFLWAIKSMKDCACLKGLDEHGFAPVSENLFLSESQYNKISNNCKYLICFYDNDLAGISNMNKIRKKFPNVYCVWIPRSYGCKDLSDFYLKYGHDKTKKLLTWMKQKVKLESKRRKEKEVELTQEEKVMLMN